MLQKISRGKKYSVIIDMISKFHQITLDENSVKDTAFMGIFIFCIPFGLKGAPAYFQKLMSSIVLLSLIYIILEVYIDDIIIYGETEEEIVYNTLLVFQRFRHYKLKLHPKKCVFGSSEIHCVGHVLNGEAITFSKKKTDFVVDFKKPITQGELKSFIGVATYFYSHIKNFAILSHPLHDLVKSYDKKKKIVWTDETEQAFQNVKDAINNIPTLYFISDNKEVYLTTDASDYAIGAYLYQLDENQNELPVAFLSKSLTPQEQKWDTIDKEAFAIYYALIKLEYLIRDIHFILKTDHKNLTFINSDYKNRVKRWKLAIQNYNFHTEHIPGKDNFIADSFSRLVPNETIAEEVLLIDDFKIPDDKYDIIKLVHNKNTGHHGVERTLHKLNLLNQNWKNRREHVKRFIKQCQCCEKMSRIKVPIQTLKFTTSTYGVWDQINIDTIGPLPADEWGNTYIIGLIDTFSRFLLLYPTKDATAKSAANCILHAIGTFGCPMQLLSDNGPQYVNQIIDELLYIIGTEHKLTLAYSHQENSIIERSNKETGRHLRNIIFHGNVITRWSQNLPLVQRIFNSEINESIGVSPAQIIFGNSLNLDRGIFLPYTSLDNKSLSDWTATMLQTQADIIQAAMYLQVIKNIKHLNPTTDESLTSNNEPINLITPIAQFPINSYVLVDYENKPPSKLHPLLKGPYLVINSIGNKYTLKNLITDTNEDYHITKLRPFYYDSTKVDPKLIANKDQQMVIVENILDMKGNPHASRKDLYFLVKWKDCDERENSWESYANLRHNSILHQFLTANKLKKLIPK